MSNETKKKIKYDAEYISYVANGDSAAVFITRDIVESINTQGKWIDVSNIVDAEKYEYEFDEKYFSRWDFKSFDVELFPRKIQPVYPENISDEHKKYITWQTSQKDIASQRQAGYVGTKFRICQND